MAYQTGISGFARVPGAADPNKVYALGKGGRAIADAADLMKATGAASVAEAWKLAKVQTFSPEQAFSKGIRAEGIGAPTATIPKPIPIARPEPISETGRLDVGEGLDVPVTVVPKRPVLDTLESKPTTAAITTPELNGLGERFGIDEVDETPISFEPAMTGNVVIDAYNKREDVRKTIEKAFPGQDPFKRGTEANTWLNNWWNRTGKVEMAEQVPLTEDIAVVTGDNLVDYYNTRPDVQAAAEEAFPGQDPLQQGTESNEWLENWWNTIGISEAKDETAKGTFAPTGELTELVEPYAEPVIGTGIDLVDYYNHRPDVIDQMKESFPGQDPLEKGTEANTWLNDWFERTGKAEMKDEVSKGTFAPSVTPTSDAETIIPEGTTEQKSTMQSIIDKVRELMGIKKEAFEEAAVEFGLEEKSDKITEIQTTIQDRKEYFTAEKERIANRLASGHVVAAEQATLEGQRITEMTNLDIREAIAQGNWDRAHSLAKESAQDAYDAAELEIKALEIQGMIDENEKDDLMDMLKFHRDLALDGFIAITPEEAADLPVENYITLPDGSIYALPVDFGAEVDTQAITLPDGRIQLINKATGEVIRTYGDPDIEGDGEYKDAQYKAATYANRMTNASEIITGMEADLKAKWAGTQWLEGMYPNWMKPAERQVYEQAMRNFVNAVLRQESGAAIADSEFESAKKQYFPQPGDSQAVIDQKRKNRETSINGMVEQAGGAFSSVGSDTNSATLALAGSVDGEKGGQCGRFVNQITGLGVGDSYASKMSKMDMSIKTPEPGMVFTMPYKDTGHCGFIVSIKDGKATVKDSNWSLNEKIKTHVIDISKMTGFADYSRLA